MNIFRFHTSIYVYEYNLDIVILQSVFENNDLDVMFDTAFCFNKYYLNISKKT